jgi:predicted DNA-binding transcriptional regulator YafY
VRTVHPYRLVHHRYSWYLLAFDELRQKILVFSLSRIRELKHLDEQFTLPKDFRVEQCIDPHFGIHVGDEPFEVEILIPPHLTTVIMEHVPSPGTSVKESEGGRLSVRFRTNQRDELIHWILKWGRNIEVVQPQWVREQLAEIGEFYTRRYRQRQGGCSTVENICSSYCSSIWQSQ